LNQVTYLQMDVPIASKKLLSSPDQKVYPFSAQLASERYWKNQKFPMPTMGGVGAGE
jgi:hypothetical protein